MQKASSLLPPPVRDVLASLSEVSAHKVQVSRELSARRVRKRVQDLFCSLELFQSVVRDGSQSFELMARLAVLATVLPIEVDSDMARRLGHNVSLWADAHIFELLHTPVVSAICCDARPLEG